ncbi:MAG: cytochrome c family protein [Brevundimonas sp.]|nr:cytochrome c family protein [Brevundimonas sp.]
MKPSPSLRFAGLTCAALAVVACGDSSGTPMPKAPPPEPLTAEQISLALAALPAPYNEADYENGRRAFARCRACHTVTEGGPNMTGPNLWGVFGRPAGQHEGYNYSKALQAADFTWDGEQLDQWLANPRTFLPGNKMNFAGMPGDQDRRDLIAWLKIETSPR